MAGFSRGQGVPLHMGLQQLSHEVYSGLDQTITVFNLDRLFPARCIHVHVPGVNLDRLFPARIILGVKADQARLYPGYIIAWANLYPGVYYGLMEYELA